MTKLDISMFMHGKTHFKIEADSRTRKMTYQGRWQRLEIFHNFLDYRNQSRNRFYILGFNDYDRMQVQTVEEMHTAAVLMGYDEEILVVIDSLCNA